MTVRTVGTLGSGVLQPMCVYSSVLLTQLRTAPLVEKTDCDVCTGVSDESTEVLSVQELGLPAQGESGDSLEQEDVQEKLEQGQRCVTNVTTHT